MKRILIDEITSDYDNGDLYRGVYIRLIERKDAEFARTLHNSASVLFALKDIHHVSTQQQSAWIESIILSKVARRYIVSTQLTSDIRDPIIPVGIIRVDEIDYINRSVMLGIDVAENAHRRGIATKSYEYMMWYFFDQLGMHRIYLDVLSTNVAAYNLYKKLGFTNEGHQRDAIFRHGKFHDYIRMSILEDEYREQK